MMYDKLPLIITAIAYIIVQAHAQDWGDTPGDPLDPSFVGDTMSTGMNLEMEQQAKDAGIITGNNPQYSSDRGPTTTYLGTPPAGAEIDVSPTPNTPTMNTAEVENVNATGTWSLDLLGEPTRHIDLSITQNKDAIMGYGAISGGNGTQRVTASGSLSGDKIVLTVMPINSLDLYKLDLSIDPHTSGTYTAYSASGDTWSGDVTGTTPAGISSTADLGSGSASLGQGYSRSVSSSTSMSMDSSGGSSGMQSVSSVSSE
ncbi:MAG: hypothetical protein WB392_14650 [Methanotrichaceae archaeon]